MLQFLFTSLPIRCVIRLFIIYLCISCALSHWVPTSEFIDSLKNTVDAVGKLTSKISDLGRSREFLGRFPETKSINKCVQVLGSSAEALNLSLSAIQNPAGLDTDALYSDVTKLLTGIMNNEELCLRGIGDHDIVKRLAGQSFILVKDFLDLVHESPNSKPADIAGNDNISGSSFVDNLPFLPWIRSHATPSFAKLVRLPELLNHRSEPGETARVLAQRGSKRRRREQLQEHGGETADFVVAKDGSGSFTRIEDAIGKAPSFSERPFVIYVKGGTYYEKLNIASEKTNIWLIGDGMGATIITASHYARPDGGGAFATATFAVFASGFVAKDITFENGAGPSKDQSVALRAKGDLIAFHRCEFRSYQDTLLLESGRQFFKECTIKGSVDFICGNARAFFQNCEILVRVQLSKHYYTVAAHRGTYGNTQGGFVFQFCRVLPEDPREYAEDNNKPCYLGRPWGQSAVTVFMQSYLGDIISPQGWIQWGNEPIDNAHSLYLYAEQGNTGPGADTRGRVLWKNTYRRLPLETALPYTVQNWINGDIWLPATAVPFIPLGL